MFIFHNTNSLRFRADVHTNCAMNTMHSSPFSQANQFHINLNQTGESYLNT